MMKLRAAVMALAGFAVVLASSSAGLAKDGVPGSGPLPQGTSPAPIVWIEGQGEAFMCFDSFPPTAIPDTSGIGVPCNITANRTIQDLNVYLDIPHTWVGDLSVRLVHQATTTSVVIMDRPGVPATMFGCAEDDVDVMLNDEGTAPVETFCGPGAPAIQGDLTPNNALSAFDGENFTGPGYWVLVVEDGRAGDTGMLNDWYLIDADDDHDGCTASREEGGNPLLGGLRDLDNFWDFFDTPGVANVRDRAISAGDLARVVERFGSSGSKSIDPLAAPPPPTAYHTAFDRTPPGTAPNGIDQSANGSITVQDISVIVSQFGHTCA
ncbi:MAG: flexitail domain-containing putative surface protein [Dehalococcoidia bacterium]